MENRHESESSNKGGFKINLGIFMIAQVFILENPLIETENNHFYTTYLAADYPPFDAAKVAL